MTVKYVHLFFQSMRPNRIFCMTFLAPADLQHPIVECFGDLATWCAGSWAFHKATACTGVRSRSNFCTVGCQRNSGYPGKKDGVVQGLQWRQRLCSWHKGENWQDVEGTWGSYPDWVSAALQGACGNTNIRMGRAWQEPNTLLQQDPREGTTPTGPSLSWRRWSALVGLWSSNSREHIHIGAGSGNHRTGSGKIQWILMLWWGRGPSTKGWQLQPHQGWL